MTYEQLIDKMRELLDNLEEVVENLRFNTEIIGADPSNEIFLKPEIIWQLILNNLQEVIDAHREKDA